MRSTIPLALARSLPCALAIALFTHALACAPTVPCTISEECPAGESCVVGAAGARCMRAPLAPLEPTTVEPAPPPRGRIVLVDASTSALSPSSAGGAFSLRPLATVNRP